MQMYIRCETVVGAVVTVSAAVAAPSASTPAPATREEVKRFNLLLFECERKFKYSSNAIMARY